MTINNLKKSIHGLTAPDVPPMLLSMISATASKASDGLSHTILSIQSNNSEREREKEIQYHEKKIYQSYYAFKYMRITMK